MKLWNSRMKQQGQVGGSVCAPWSGRGCSVRGGAGAVLLWMACCGQPILLPGQDAPLPVMAPPSPPLLDQAPPTGELSGDAGELSGDDGAVVLAPPEFQNPAANTLVVGTGGVVRTVWRDPFWPVGYTGRKALPRPVATPTPTAPAPQAPMSPTWVEDWAAAQKKLVVSGISGGGRAKIFSAIVNGRLVTPGSQVSAVLNGVTYFWRIETIDKEGLTYARVRAELASP